MPATQAASSQDLLRIVLGSLRAAKYEKISSAPQNSHARISYGIFYLIFIGAPAGFVQEGLRMRKGSTRKPQADEPATRVKNYITRSGLQRLKDEHQFLLTRER